MFGPAPLREPGETMPGTRKPSGKNYAKSLEEERALKDRFLGTQPESPFAEENLPFHGLKYFPAEPKWRIPARFTETRAESAEEVWLRTNRDGHASMRKLGVLTFEVKGKKCQLTLFHAGPQAGNVAFLPFRDATSGKETYGPGRYLNLELQEGTSYTLDF